MLPVLEAVLSEFGSRLSAKERDLDAEGVVAEAAEAG
jgi:hypothetical protein